MSGKLKWRTVAKIGWDSVSTQHVGPRNFSILAARIIGQQWCMLGSLRFCNEDEDFYNWKNTSWLRCDIINIQSWWSIFEYFLAFNYFFTLWSSQYKLLELKFCHEVLSVILFDWRHLFDVNQVAPPILVRGPFSW